MMLEGDGQTSLRGKGASRDLPTPSPTVRTRSPSVPCDPDYWPPSWLSPTSRKRKAVRRLFRYTPLPTSTYSDIVQHMHFFMGNWDASQNDIDAWVQNVPQESRPRDRPEMKKRMRQFRTQLKAIHRFTTPSLPRPSIDMCNQTDDNSLRRATPVEKDSQQPSQQESYTSLATHFSDRSCSDCLEYSSEGGDPDDIRRPLTPSTQLGSDAKPWHQAHFDDGNDEGNDELHTDSLRSATSVCPFLVEKSHHSTEDHYDFQDTQAHLFQSKHDLSGLRQILSEDEYSEGYVEDIYLLLDNLSSCSNTDRPSDNAIYHDPSYWIDYWRHLDEWRALPFEGSLLPSDFLHVDQHRTYFGTCLEGSQAHDEESCLCAAPDDNLKNLWVTPSGLSPNAKIMLEKEEITREDTENYDHFGNRLLHFLAARGTVQVLFNALDVGADISSLNFGGQTFVHCLGPVWFTDVLSSLQTLLVRLAQQGFSFSQRDSYGQSIFHTLARRLDDWETVLPLWSNDISSACLRQRDAFGYQPSNISKDEGGLHLLVPSLQVPEKSPIVITVHTPSPGNGNIFGISQGSVSCQGPLEHLVPHVAAMISSKGPLDEDDKGRNALHRLGACTFQVTMDRASMQHDWDIMSMRRGFSEDGCVSALLPYRRHLSQLRLSLLDFFLAQGVDIDAYNASGNTVLMEFVIHFPYDESSDQPQSILEALLEHGASVNARNREGETALHLAGRHGRKVVLELLLVHGANVHARNRQGQSLLQMLEDQIGCLDITDNARQPFIECYDWLSREPVGCLTRPSLLDEFSPGNICLEPPPQAPSVKKMISDILSSFRSTDQDTNRRLNVSQARKEDRFLNDPGFNEPVQGTSYSAEYLDAYAAVQSEVATDDQSLRSSIMEHLEATNPVEELCNHITYSLFGVTASDLVHSEAIFQSVASCVDDISVLMQQEQQIVTCGSGHVSRSNQGCDTSSYSQSSSARPSKRRKVQDDDGSQDPGDQSGNSPQRPADGKRTSSQANREKLRDLACPFRRRNGSRFNCREYLVCAYRSFRDLSDVKTHIKSHHALKGSSGSPCPRCHNVFPTKQDVTNHLREPQICEISKANPDVATSEFDPENGITEKTADILNKKTKLEKVANWHTLWQTLFPDDTDIPSSDYEPMIDFLEVERDFHKNSEDALLTLQQFRQSPIQYGDGDTSCQAQEVLDRLVNNVLKGCRVRALARPRRTPLPDRIDSGQTTTATSSIVADSSSRYVRIMPTPTSMTQPPDSPSTQSVVTSKKRPTPPPVMPQVTSTEPSSSAAHNAMTEKSASLSSFPVFPVSINHHETAMPPMHGPAYSEPAFSSTGQPEAMQFINTDLTNYYLAAAIGQQEAGLGHNNSRTANTYGLPGNEGDCDVDWLNTGETTRFTGSYFDSLQGQTLDETGKNGEGANGTTSSSTEEGLS